MKEYNSNQHKWQSIFDNLSVGDNDIDDCDMSDEKVRIEIRDKYIKDATYLSAENVNPFKPSLHLKQ